MSARSSVVHTDNSHSMAVLPPKGNQENTFASNQCYQEDDITADPLYAHSKLPTIRQSSQPKIDLLSVELSDDSPEINKGMSQLDQLRYLISNRQKT